MAQGGERENYLTKTLADDKIIMAKNNVVTAK
jgi:hypothetical protein